jgi:hypothetical protein
VKGLLQVIVLVGMSCFLQLEIESPCVVFVSFWHSHVSFLVPLDKQQSVEVKREPLMIRSNAITSLIIEKVLLP